MGIRRTTFTWVVELSSNPTAVEPKRDGALQRFAAIIGVGVLMVRATWALICWGR